MSKKPKVPPTSDAALADQKHRRLAAKARKKYAAYVKRTTGR